MKAQEFNYRFMEVDKYTFYTGMALQAVIEMLGPDADPTIVASKALEYAKAIRHAERPAFKRTLKATANDVGCKTNFFI